MPDSSPTPGSPSNSDSPFDKDGNTKSFGIPSGMIGNAHKGKKIYFGSCSGCHASVVGKHASYSSLTKSLSRTPMDALHISRENTAHLVAYLNFIK